jgi:hypothetical protein
MSGWTRPPLFLDRAFSLSKIVCSAHIADARIRGARRTRQQLSYTCVRMISCQAMRCGNFMASQVLKS